MTPLVDFVLSPQTIRFKEWVSEIPTHKELLREYDKAILSKSALFAGAPYRAGKLLLFTGIGAGLGAALGPLGAGAGGLLGAGADLALSAGDEFFLSKIDLGWKPNQWVRDSALPLLNRH